MVVHGKLGEVLPQPEGPSGVHDSREDPVEDKEVKDQEKGQGDHRGGVVSVEGVLQG